MSVFSIHLYYFTFLPGCALPPSSVGQAWLQVGMDGSATPVLTTVTTAPGPQPLCLRFLSSESEGTALHSEDSSSSESMTLGVSGSIPWVQCVHASCESLLYVH